MGGKSKEEYDSTLLFVNSQVDKDEVVRVLTGNEYGLADA
jgi:hypothetical protein